MCKHRKSLLRSVVTILNRLILHMRINEMSCCLALLRYFIA